MHTGSGVTARASRGIEADRGRGGEVETLRLAVDRDRDAVVGECGQLGRKAPGLVAEQPRRRSGEQTVVGRVVQVDLTGTIGSEHDQAGSLGTAYGVRGLGLGREWQVKETAHGGPHGLGVVGVDGASRQHDRVGSGRVGGADHRARVAGVPDVGADGDEARSEEHTSELQSLMRISYAVYYLKQTKNK